MTSEVRSDTTGSYFAIFHVNAVHVNRVIISTKQGLSEEQVRKVFKERNEELSRRGSGRDEETGSSSQIYPSQLFCQEEGGNSPEMRSISLEEIFQDVKTGDGHMKKCRRILFLGPMGTGKTITLITLLKHDSLKDKVVVFVNLAEFSTTDEVSPAHALLSQYFPTWDKMNEVFCWILKNPEKVAFIMDSLDDFPFDFTKEPPIIGFDEKSKITDILHNLLAGNLLPNSIVASSARQLADDALHPTVKPDRYIHVEGFARSSIVEYLKNLLGNERGLEVYEILQNDFPEIGQMLENPLFLYFTALAFNTDHANEDKVSTPENSNEAKTKASDTSPNRPPDTEAGIIVNFLLQATRSKHMSSEDISYLEELMHICFDEMRKGTDVQLSKKIKACGFCAAVHIPAFLAACCIITKSMEGFEEIIPEDLKKESLQFARRHLSGVMFDKEVFYKALDLLGISDTEIPDLDKKQDIFREDLLESLREAMGGTDKSDLLNVFMVLKEGKDGVEKIILSTIKDQSISFRAYPLTSCHVNAIGSVIRYAESLKSLNLAECQLDAKKIHKLKEEVKCSTKILRVDVSGNPHIGEKGMAHLGKFTNGCGASEVNISSCNLGRKHMWNFHDERDGKKLSKIDASRNKDIGRGVYYLGRLIENKGCLLVSQCNLDQFHVNDLCEGLGDTKVKLLWLDDVWDNPSFHPDLLKLLSRVEKQLDLSGWKIDEKQQDLIRELLQETGKQTSLKVIVCDGCTLEAVERLVTSRSAPDLTKLNHGADVVNDIPKERIRKGSQHINELASMRATPVPGCSMKSGQGPAVTSDASRPGLHVTTEIKDDVKELMKRVLPEISETQQPTIFIYLDKKTINAAKCNLGQWTITSENESTTLNVNEPPKKEQGEMSSDDKE